MSRVVRTAEGAAYFGVPIGTIISSSEELGLKRKAKRLGLRPPLEAQTTETGEVKIDPKDSMLEGPLTVHVGGRSYNLPEGSKVMKSSTNSTLVYVQVPGGGIHLLTPRGEIEIPENQLQAIRERFVEATADDDSSTSNEVLLDLDGEEQFVRTEDGDWEHVALGLVISVSDMKKAIEEGELKAQASDDKKKKPAADSK